MRLAVLSSAVLLFTGVNAFASGSVGIYGIISKVVFEPNEQAPERIQIWGAFAFVENRQQSLTAVKRGVLYFTLPTGAGAASPETVRREWADLKTVAGTGQAVAFGQWFYLGPFGAVQPDGVGARAGRILSPGDAPETDVRVRSETEPLTSPSAYATNVGVVKLTDDGNHSEIVKQLKESLKK